MIEFWYGLFALVFVAGVALGVRRAAFDPKGESPPQTDNTPTLTARIYGWFGIGDIDEDLALAATLCTAGLVSVSLHGIAHAIMRSYPGWFGLLALSTGLAAGLGLARLLCRTARGGW